MCKQLCEEFLKEYDYKWIRPNNIKVWKPEWSKVSHGENDMWEECLHHELAERRIEQVYKDGRHVRNIVYFRKKVE